MAATASVLLRQQQQDRFMSTDMTTPTSKGSSSDFLPRSQALQEHSHHSHTHSHHSSDQSPPPAGVVATADALFEAIHLQNHNHSHLAPHANPPQSAALSSPVAVNGHQLPTPRTSISSGASSPPEFMSPNSRPSQHQHQHQQTPSSFSSYPHTTSFASPSGSDVQSTIASPLHHPHVQHLKASSASNPRPPMGGLSNLHNSGKYSASPALNTKLGQPHSGPTSPATSSAMGMDGNSFSTLAGRSAASQVHVDESGQVMGHAHYPSHYEQHQQQQQQQQHQQQLQEQHDLFLADEKEAQKKNARSALNGASSYLPPGLNHTLNKVVQSAKEVVTTHSVLPSTHRPLTSTSLGSGNGGVYSSQPRIGTRSLSHLIVRLYRASKLPLICMSWYLSSAVTNNLGKQLMNQFRYPVTLTFVQFWFVSLFCYIAGAVFKMTKIHRPSRVIFEMTGPLVVFQVIGHVFSSVAISRVPLSVVHTIKALTPLFTVLFYRVILGTTYSRAVYLSLVPLTAGVMLACRLSLEFNNMVGLLSALLSTLVFVTQNVFTKKILSSSKAKQQQHQEQHGHGGLANKESISIGTVDPVEQLGGSNAKLDKINILFYSSTMAAIFMIPMWLYTEGWTLMFTEEAMGHHVSAAANGGWSVSWLLFTNSVSHFFQNVFAFSVLALTSPVTYSIASLIKRIVVIVASIVYFHQTLGTTQWMGVCLTFWGLWLYNSAKNAAKVDPSSGILKGTSMGKRMSKNFGRGLLDEDTEHKKGGFIV
ncbi:hypothetical protein MVEG_09883 [Podila verticillata NRRL 6337]|nr:hypothetical protein MVEG_09883 [Podila verticillata NRRL 6337]